jgi:serine phosphatase RsbU (regulator of sigma subunit)
MTTSAAKILLIEENALDTRLIREIMKNSRMLSFELDFANSLASALTRLSSANFDAILADLSLPDSRGIDTYTKLHNHSPMTPIIILTGADDEDLAHDLLQKGAQDFLVKGQLNRNQLERSVSYALERHKILDELNKSRESLAATKKELEMTLRSINDELETARRVQKAFLPQDSFSIPGVEICTIFSPTGSIGGDLYDIIPLDDHRTAILLLDVAGHGIPAALISAMAKLSFARHIRKGIDPQEIFQRVNNELIHYMPPERFVTAFLGFIDTALMEFTHSRAANPAALLCHAKTRSGEFLTTGGTFIGMFPDARFEQKTVSVAPGDKLVIYTDGLIECTNEKDEQFGKARLEKSILDSLDSDAGETTAELLKEVRAHTAGLPQSDDITLVVLAILKPTDSTAQ